MDHRYSESSQRIQSAESIQSYAQGAKGNIKDPKIIRYSGGVTSASGERGGLIYTRSNNVSQFQRIFQAKSALPVFLKRGRSDELVYKGLMTASLVGLVVASFGMYKLAMPSKPN